MQGTGSKRAIPTPESILPKTARPLRSGQIPNAIPLHDKALYRKRHKIENMFGKLKDWRRIHTRYDRCAHTFMSAIAIAATVLFWL
jgi:transposase